MLQPFLSFIARSSLSQEDLIRLVYSEVQEHDLAQRHIFRWGATAAFDFDTGQEVNHNATESNFEMSKCSGGYDRR